MKFSVAAAIAFAAGAQAAYAASNVTYTTEIVTAYTTFCPAATEITHGGKTYTVTEATTLTITDCPCTISKPVYTTSTVLCSTCSAAPTESPVYPTTNSTLATSVPSSTGGYIPTTAPTTAPTTVPTAGAVKVAAAGLVGFLGFAVAVL